MVQSSSLFRAVATISLAHWLQRDSKMSFGDLVHKMGMQLMALVVGLLLSMVVITGFEALAIVANQERYATGLPDHMPDEAAAIVLAGYVVGIAVAAFVMCHLTDKSVLASLLLSITLSGSQYVHYIQQQQLEELGRKRRAFEPFWFHMAAIVCFIPAALIGCRIARVSSRVALKQAPPQKVKTS